jgi:hypothetical protein
MYGSQLSIADIILTGLVFLMFSRYGKKRMDISADLLGADDSLLCLNTSIRPAPKKTEDHSSTSSSIKSMEKLGSWKRFVHKKKNENGENIGQKMCHVVSAEHLIAGSDLSFLDTPIRHHSKCSSRNLSSTDMSSGKSEMSRDKQDSVQTRAHSKKNEKGETVRQKRPVVSDFSFCGTPAQFPKPASSGCLGNKSINSRTGSRRERVSNISTCRPVGTGLSIDQTTPRSQPSVSTETSVRRLEDEKWFVYVKKNFRGISDDGLLRLADAFEDQIRIIGNARNGWYQLASFLFSHSTQAKLFFMQILCKTYANPILDSVANPI